MPRIRIQERASVSDDFVELYRRTAETKLRFELNKIKSMSREFARTYMLQSPSKFGRLGAIVKGHNGPGVGMDFEKARLRSLDYQRFFTLEHRGEMYFCGQTRDVVMEEYGGANKCVARWDIGSYTIYVPVRTLLSVKPDLIHMVPDRSPLTVSRHPHHRASYDGDHPLDRFPVTCWSQFATPVSIAVSEVNLVELFRFLRTFVGRYNNRSPLTNIDHNFMWRINPDENRART